VRLVCHEKGVSDYVQLLRFYFPSTLMEQMTLGRLSRLFFIVHLVQALVACSHQRNPESPGLASMQREVVDVLMVILLVRLSETACCLLSPLNSLFYDAVFHPNSPCASVAVVRVTGQLSDVIFSFSFLLLDKWKEEQIGNVSAPLHSVLVEI
jgi:hypothetical protein